MKKLYGKMIAAILTITMAFSLVIVSTYAWVTISTAPLATGIQITISGGNTILIAPDIQSEIDGSIYHYPGQFDNNLNFAQNSNYSYLSKLYGLLPVSTVDGQNWILPDYYTAEDREVQTGEKPAGEIKPINEFIVDTSLEFANLQDASEDSDIHGSYIYFDFWVVSPGTEYQLRVSAGAEDDGSFVIGLAEPVEVDTDGDGAMDSYTLENQDVTAAASARIGFLVNQNYASQESMQLYKESNSYSERYEHLLGEYQEKGKALSEFYFNENRFIIYEPNADLHVEEAYDAPDGSYVMTKPLNIQEGVIGETEVLENHLAVQLKNHWKTSASGQDSMIEQIFQTSIVGKTLDMLSGQNLKKDFYNSYLQNQVAHYVVPGKFLSRTSDLYAFAHTGNGVVSPETFMGLQSASAPDDTIIVQLERNVPQRIRMFVWLEGQDVDCKNNITISDFALGITLSGSSEQNG